MLKIFVTTRDGLTNETSAKVGLSLMKIITDAGMDEMLAICGGACSCATCHVYVEPAWVSKLPPMTEFEDALLDSTDARRPASRLSCQLRFEEDLDGLPVTIAPED